MSTLCGCFLRLAVTVSHSVDDVLEASNMIVTSTTMTRVQPIALCGRCSCMVVVIGWTTSTMYRMVWQSHRMVIGRGLVCHRQLCWWVIMLGLRRGTCGLEGWPSGLWGGDAYGIQGLCMVSVRGIIQCAVVFNEASHLVSYRRSYT